MKTTREILREKLESEIQFRQKLLANINEIHGLDDLTLTPTIYDQQIDFDNLPRADVEAVLRHIGGTWSKTPDGDATINYETKQNGLTIRMWRGQPPPNCKIVEVVEEVPAQPARLVTVRKLQCV